MLVTYVVEHKEVPRIGLDTIVNGGRAVVIAAGDYSARVEKMEKLLNKLLEKTNDDETVLAIEKCLRDCSDT